MQYLYSVPKEISSLNKCRSDKLSLYQRYLSPADAKEKEIQVQSLMCVVEFTQSRRKNTLSEN